MMMSLSAYYGAVLNCAPPFMYCPPPADGSACELTIGIIMENAAHFVWTTVLIISAFQLIIQPVRCLATDGGPFGPAFAEATTSYTESCLHLMLRILVFQIIGTVRALPCILPVACPPLHTARRVLVFQIIGTVRAKD